MTQFEQSVVAALAVLSIWLGTMALHRRNPQGGDRGEKGDKGETGQEAARAIRAAAAVGGIRLREHSDMSFGESTSGYLIHRHTTTIDQLTDRLVCLMKCHAPEKIDELREAICASRGLIAPMRMSADSWLSGLAETDVGRSVKSASPEAAAVIAQTADYICSNFSAGESREAGCMYWSHLLSVGHNNWMADPGRQKVA